MTSATATRRVRWLLIGLALVAAVALAGCPDSNEGDGGDGGYAHVDEGLSVYPDRPDPINADEPTEPHGS